MDFYAIGARAHMKQQHRSVAFATPIGGRYVVGAAQVLMLPPPGFDELTPEEKLEYVAALWDRIVDDEHALPISDAQRRFLRERLESHRADPGAARPWSEVRREIEATLGDRPRR